MDLLEHLKSALTDRYVIERELGAGGMAIVYLAKDSKHDRLVALKVLRPELAVSIGKERFLLEIKIAAKLSHPHILPLYDSGAAGDFLFYVMPYVEGESLRDMIGREQQLSIDEAMRIAREVAEALGVAHSQGIIHRDIKPENIMLSGGHAVVADFGIARALSAAGGEGLTQTGMAIGTPAYMSPEQSVGDSHVDGRADVYSLGCVLYEMLVGQPPFDGPTISAVMARHAMDVVPSMLIMRGTIPQQLEAAVMCALAKTPADRFHTAGDLAEALSAIFTGTQARIPTIAFEQRKRRRAKLSRWLLTAGGALALLVVGAMAWQLLNPSAPTVRNVNGLDLTRVAVLYFDDHSRDNTLGHVADGLTEGLIGRLNTVSALHVVSRNGVARYKGSELAKDSIARALNAGTLIAGSVEPDGDDLRVQVNLVEGTSGSVIHRANIQLPADLLLAVLDSVVLEVSRFMRERIGEEVVTRERRAASALAWALVQRGEQLHKQAETRAEQGDVAGALRSLTLADSMLAVAEVEDPEWVEPIVLRGWVAYERARLLDDRQSALSGLDETYEFADRAIALELSEAGAFEIRGTARFFSWSRYRPLDRNEADVMFESAKADLVRAIEFDPSLASAHYMLSQVHRQDGNEVEAMIEARLAYTEDSYLQIADRILVELFSDAYWLEEHAQGLRWCEEGRRRFPNNHRFWRCRIWLMTTDALEPNVAEAWSYVERFEELVPAQEKELASHSIRIWVGGILARAGLPDSARNVLFAARADRSIDPTRSLLYNEAYMRVLLGDLDEAYDLLREYHAANPEEDHGEGEAGDVFWWWRDIHNLPQFATIFHGRR